MYQDVISVIFVSLKEYGRTQKHNSLSDRVYAPSFIFYHMKKIILLFLFLFSLFPIHATIVTGFALQKINGEKIECLFLDKPEFTFDGNELTLTTKQIQVNLSIEDIKDMTFDIIEPAAVEQISMMDESTIRIICSETSVAISGLKVKDMVNLFTSGGQFIRSEKADSMGRVVVQISDITRGNYIIKTPTASFKIHK